MSFQYTSINRVFNTLEMDEIDFSERKVIEWVGEALELIGAVRQFEEAVAFIEVENHQCTMPRWLHSIIQIARNNLWSPNKERFCPQAIAAAVAMDEAENLAPVALDQWGMPINAYDVAYYRPYFDLKYDYLSWSKSSLCRGSFTPVRLTNHNFFNTLVCTVEDNTRGLYQNATDEYNIIDGSVLRFSFKEGQVAVAFNRQKIDEEGYPMIPDHASFILALTWYVKMKMASIDFTKGRDGSKGRLDYADSRWDWYCKQAGSLAMMPHGEDEHQNLLEQRSYLLPRQDKYYGFFGNLGKAESRRFNRR